MVGHEDDDVLPENPAEPRVELLAEENRRRQMTLGAQGSPDGLTLGIPLDHGIDGLQQARRRGFPLALILLPRISGLLEFLCGQMGNAQFLLAGRNNRREPRPRNGPRDTGTQRNRLDRETPRLKLACLLLGVAPPRRKERDEQTEDPTHAFDIAQSFPDAKRNQQTDRLALPRHGPGGSGPQSRSSSPFIASARISMVWLTTGAPGRPRRCD